MANIYRITTHYPDSSKQVEYTATGGEISGIIVPKISSGANFTLDVLRPDFVVEGSFTPSAVAVFLTEQLEYAIGLFTEGVVAAIPAPEPTPPAPGETPDPEPPPEEPVNP